MSFVLAQVFGGIALILVAIGYFTKSKSSFLIYQVIADFFYALAFFVVDAWTAGIITIISMIRCIYLYFQEKKNFKYNTYYLLCFVSLYVLTTCLFWEGFLDLMPLATSIMFTFGYEIKNMQVMRYFLIIPNVILVMYNVITTTYASALLDFMEVVVIIASIIKFSKRKAKIIE